MVSVMFPNEPIDVAATGVMANVLAVPAAMQELFAVTLTFPFDAPQVIFRFTEFVPASEMIETPEGVDQL